jgi:hypothetical protein
MREVNDHIKEVVGVKEIKPQQPKTSFNPLNWNWTAIIAWTVIGIIQYNILKHITDLL